MIDVTIAICTWNRCASLATTLECLTHLDPPTRATWEVLVVDNASTDATQEVLRQWQPRLPLRSVVEQQPGLSNARNRAVAEAHGRWILWTDDDVLVARDWLSEYAVAFDAWPNAGFMGGPVDVWLQGQPPAWLVEVADTVPTAFAAIDHGPEPRSLDQHHLPFGANMAARADLHRRRPFDPNLGRKHGSMLSGEESAFFEALLADGIVGRWIPSARVKHAVPAERQTWEYLRRYFYGAGFSTSVMLPPGQRRWAGVEPWIIRRTAEAGVRYAIARLTKSRRTWIRAFVQWHRMRGMLAHRLSSR